LLGLGVALLIEAQKSFKDFYRTIFFLPVMATLIAMAISWQFILHPTFGFLNLLLKEFGLSGHNWLRTEGLALWVLAAIGIWNQFGFNMVLFLAGLVSIPRHLYDAAATAGACATASELTKSVAAVNAIAQGTFKNCLIFMSVSKRVDGQRANGVGHQKASKKI